MTSIYKQEDKHYIYQSEKPFPRREECNEDEMYLESQLQKSTESWFKNAKRIVVKEGEEEKFLIFIYDSMGHKRLIPPEALVKIREGVEIPSSCYRVSKVYVEPSSSIHCNRGSDVDMAVFVDSVPHAKGKVTEWIKEMNNACDKYGMPNVGSVQFNKVILDYFNLLPPPPNDKP